MVSDGKRMTTTEQSVLLTRKDLSDAKMRSDGATILYIHVEASFREKYILGASQIQSTAIQSSASVSCFFFSSAR